MRLNPRYALNVPQSAQSLLGRTVEGRQETEIGAGNGVCWYGSGNAAGCERSQLYSVLESTPICMQRPSCPAQVLQNERSEVVDDGCSIAFIYGDTNFGR
jgi:hypothetical protein